MSAAFWKALLFGVVLAGSIGPIALLVFGTAARRGLAAGCFAGLGAAIADFLYAVVALTGGALILPRVMEHATAIRIACALLLIALGLSMAFTGVRRSTPAEIPPRAASSLWPTFLLTLVNPMTLVVFVGFVPQLPVAGSPQVVLALAVALFAGSLLVQVALATAGTLIGRALPGEGWQRAISLAAAAGILGFGVAGLTAAA